MFRGGTQGYAHPGDSQATLGPRNFCSWEWQIPQSLNSGLSTEPNPQASVKEWLKGKPPRRFEFCSHQCTPQHSSANPAAGASWLPDHGPQQPLCWPKLDSHGWMPAWCNSADLTALWCAYKGKDFVLTGCGIKAMPLECCCVGSLLRLSLGLEEQDCKCKALPPCTAQLLPAMLPGAGEWLGSWDLITACGIHLSLGSQKISDLT